MRVMVAGSIGQRPDRGGHAWVFLQYLLGFAAMGCDVLFVDRLEHDMCFDPSGSPCPPERSVNFRYVADVMAWAGLSDRYAVVVDSGRHSLGMDMAGVRTWAHGADLLVDVMGFLHVEALMEAPSTRLYLDIDPGFPQLWSEAGLYDGLGRHDCYATYGSLIGTESCTIPTCGLEWTPTRPPVVMSLWPYSATRVRSVTSVCTWRGPYDAIEHEGARFGLRAHRMRDLAQMPRVVDAELGVDFELALDIDESDEADARMLREGGWRLVDPVSAAGTAATYRDYIQSSSAELLVPKDVYLRGRTGWFSDRSACYLASGKPVIALDPGEPVARGSSSGGCISSVYPTGKGLVTFNDVRDGTEAVGDVFAHYQVHSEAARAVAEECFDADRVLEALLSDIGASR